MDTDHLLGKPGNGYDRKTTDTETRRLPGPVMTVTNG